MPVEHSLPSSEIVRSYAIRRVNPFLGVMQVIEADEGRALSCNGVVWEILVRANRGNSWGSLNRNKLNRDNRQKTYYRFGMWSLDDGLIKRANSPADQDYYELASKCETLVAYVHDRHKKLPFELADTHELWLFDSQDQQPLALLASVIADHVLPSPEPKYWSSSIGANGSPGQRRFPEAREVEAQVKQRAGFNIKKHWIDRQADGSGIIENSGRRIMSDEFPALLLAENWANDAEQKRAHDYIKWISPSLLTLQHLDQATRARIESNLNVQAVSIEHHWHLYPEIIDEKILKAARVQCKIENSS